MSNQLAILAPLSQLAPRRPKHNGKHDSFEDDCYIRWFHCSYIPPMELRLATARWLGGFGTPPLLVGWLAGARPENS